MRRVKILGACLLGTLLSCVPQEKSTEKWISPIQIGETKIVENLPLAPGYRITIWDYALANPTVSPKSYEPRSLTHFRIAKLNPHAKILGGDIYKEAGEIWGEDYERDGSVDSFQLSNYLEHNSNGPIFVTPKTDSSLKAFANKETLEKLLKQAREE